MTLLVAVVMLFSIPIVALITEHFREHAKIKHKIIKDEIELEKLKHENYIIETQKLRLELEQMKLEEYKGETKSL